MCPLDGGAMWRNVLPRLARATSQVLDSQDSLKSQERCPFVALLCQGNFFFQLEVPATESGPHFN